jgi:Ser/Thr protein kinase RdoA (MazF antagonist)
MVNKNTKPTPPQFPEQEVKQIARQLYGLDFVSVKRMDSYIDFNFYLQEKTGREFVFKIANAQEQREILEAQHQAMKHMKMHHKTLKCPGVCRTLKDEEIVVIESPSGTTHLVRMLTFLPGTIFADLKVHPPELLENLGQVLGEMCKTFANFHHPALHFYNIWDLRNTPDLETYAGYIKNLREQRLAKHFLQQFKTFVVPVFPKLRQSVIHNDVNNYNLLVDPDGEPPTITGIIDFGDMMYTHTVCELAIAIAYALHGKSDPIETAARIVVSYHKIYPLEELELEVLFYLICGRLCSTIVMSAYHLKLAPDNEYLKISVKPAREALEKLIQINPDHAVHVFRKACNLPIVPNSRVLVP